jgi:hypothetical protein
MCKHLINTLSIRCLLATACGTDHSATQQPTAHSAETATATKPELEPVFTDSTYQLTGIAAAAGGRVFVNYPYWLDKHSYSVVEVGPDDKAKPYPIPPGTALKKVTTALLNSCACRP